MASDVIPVVAGLAAGIAIIAAFASIYTAPIHTDISVDGLMPLYHVGDNITFTEKVTGYDIDCGVRPDISITSAEHTLYKVFNIGPASNCSSFELNRPHEISLGYKQVTVLADRAGNYTITATYGNGKLVKQIQVLPSKPIVVNGTIAVSCNAVLCTYSIKTENGTYAINFRFNGTIDNMSYNRTGLLDITLSPASNGTLQIAIPRKVLDSKTSIGTDDAFAVFINGIDTAYDEIPDKAKDFGITNDKLPDYRILVMPIEKDSKLVEIAATFQT